MQRIATIEAILSEKGFGPLPRTREEIYDEMAQRDADYARKKERIEAEDARRRAEARALENTPE